MGQKVHPYGIRLGIVKDWTSTWYADTGAYADYLFNDLAVREFLRKKLAHARSEEHTYELQSRSDLVCRLLLEKKNKEYAT